jgi:predicted Zn-dependent peptidase
MKIKHTGISLLLSLFISSAFAQSSFVWKNATSGGYTYKYVSGDPTHSRFYKLPNGLTVILSPTDKAPRIQSFIAVKAGSKTDPANHTGLAHYLEHMMFKGTDKYGSLNWAKEKPLLDQIDALYEQYNSTTDTAKRRKIYEQIDATSGKAAKFAIANEYDKMMASMGGQGTNAFTSLEETVYTDDIPASAVDKYLTLQAERFRHPVLRLFHTELEAVYEEKNRNLDDDNEKVEESLYAAIFPHNNYGRQTTIGTVEHLKNPSLKYIRNYYYTYYVPNNMGIIMSGDFNPDVMIKKIALKFGYMKPKLIPPYKYEPEKPITTPIKRDVYGPNPENLTIGFRFPGANTHDVEMLDLVSRVLSNGRAGLIDLDLTKKQKVLSARAVSDVNKDYSILELKGNPLKGQSLDDVKALLLAELDKLKKGDFSDDLLQSIINNAKKTTIQQNEGYESRANNLMNDFVTGVDWRSETAKISELSKVTKAELVAFVNKNFNNNNYVIVYKHQGEDKNIVKVDKPHITPVEVNREAQSPFLKMVNGLPANSVKPVWLDFDKDIQRAKVGPVDLLAVQNKDNSLFRLYYRYDMGTWNNKLMVLALQYLQYLGTDKMSADDVSKEFYKLASTFSTSTSGETSTITFTGLQENFGKTVALYEDLIANCKPNETALAALKQRLKKSRENAKLNKGNIMSGLVNYAMYGQHNPFNNVMSDAELDAVKSDDLIAILHDEVNYNHTILYYGPATAQQVADILKPLHTIPASFKPFPAQQVFNKVNQDKPQVLFANFDMVQAEIVWIRNGAAYSPAQTPTIELFNGYYGGDMSSIVFQTIRESKALAYETYAFYSEPSKQDDRYTVQAYVGTQADKFNEAIKGMNELLTDIPESDKVIETSKKNIVKSLETERVTQDGILFDYLNLKRKGINYDIRKVTFENIDKLGYKDIKAFHDSEFKNKPFTYCVVASEKRVSDDDLKKYGDLTKLSLQDIFGY